MNRVELVKEINFDMDGTIADFYGVPNWIDYLNMEDTTPYLQAKPMHHFAILARMLNHLQRQGFKIKIISWTSKRGTAEYNNAVTLAKLTWLAKHLPSVQWDEIHIIPYGTPKQNYGSGILFDDELPNRENWVGIAYEPTMILEVLKGLS